MARVSSPETVSAAAGPVSCRSCDLYEICRRCDRIAIEEERGLRRTGALRTVRAGARLYRAGTPAHSIFAVRQGMVKTVRVDPDGEERIVAISLPGDVLGVEAFGEHLYALDAVALQTTVCCELPLSVLSERCARAHELASAIITLLSRETVDQTTFTRGSISERIIALILDLSRRRERRGLDGRRFALGMTRQEIANLLDTRIETVSRTLQRMSRDGQFDLSGQWLELRAAALLQTDRGALAD